MPWYQRAKTITILRELIASAADDRLFYDFYDIIDEQRYHILNEFVDRRPDQSQSWNVVPLARVKKIWADAVRYGHVRDIKGMNQISTMIVKNIARLYANTVLMNHTPEDPHEYFEEHGIPKEDEEEAFPDWVEDKEQRQWRISDYAITPLFDDALELLGATSADEQMRIVDRVFNRVHKRSDFAALFIEGGSMGLSELATQEVDHEWPDQSRMARTAQSEHEYPIAGDIVSGLTVTNNIPNTSSISASLDDYRVLHDVRELPFSDFGDARSVFYASDDFAQSHILAEQIRDSRRIDPLIVVIDEDGPYILEGSHRFVALLELEMPTFPALVVEDLSS